MIYAYKYIFIFNEKLDIKIMKLSLIRAIVKAYRFTITQNC